MKNNEDFNILIVDDTLKNIQVLGNVLQTEGYSVEVATNGFEALDLAFSENFDLCLLDIMMPEMDGYEVCEKLRKNPKTKDLPVIFLTAKTDSESIIKGFETGGHDYVTKPFNSSELLKRVKTHIELKEKTEEVKIYADKLSTANDELNIANAELSDINTELRETIDALTKARIGKKALTIAIIITILLFILSEGIIEPEIDRSLENATAGTIYALLIKGVIALTFLPIERVLKTLLEKRVAKNHLRNLSYEK